jgi:hypothetical protein
MTKAPNPFRWFDSSPEVIRLVVMMYVRHPLSLRNVEDLLFERGIDICHETVRYRPSILKVPVQCWLISQTIAMAATARAIPIPSTQRMWPVF